MKMDKEVRRSFERKNLERAAKKAAVVGLTTLVLSTSGIQANAASRYDNSNYRGIGYISKVEEVSELGNGGYISTGAGDYGGVSYGIYQFSTTTGSARDFINWTKKNDSEVYKYFKAEGNPRPSTAAFNRAWKKAYKELGTKFEKSQYDFASEYLIKPAYNRVKKRFGLDLKKSRAREEYLISTAVQFGPGGICNLFKEVENRGIKLDDNMDDSELLSIMCNHKRDTVAYHFRSSSSKVKAAARQRFIREKKELLKIAKEESGKTLDEVKETSTSTSKASSSKEETNDVSTQEFDDVIEVNDKDIEKDYDKVEKELDEVNDVISDETQDNTESKEEDKSTTEDEDTSKEETTDEETSKDESAKEDKAEEKDNTEKEETKDEDKQESTENDSSLDNTLFVGDSHMKGAESTIKNNYDNSQVKATVGASAYVYLHDTKFFGEKLINSLPEDSDDIHQVVVSLGVNNITGATNESDVIKVLEKLQAKYPGKPIRFMLVNHVGNKYTEASVSKTNKLIDQLNKTVSDYAKEHENVSVIDASEGLETNGKLTSTNDGLHVNNNKKLLNNIEKAVEEKQDKTTLEEAPDQVKNNDEFDSIVDEDTTKDIEEPDKATEEDNDKQESSKEDKVEEKDNDSKEETSKEDKQESTEKETTDEETSKDESAKEDKESDTKEESKDEDKSTESEKESSKEETTTEDNTVEEDNDKETSKDESTKEDKSEEKDYDTKEETPAKENTTEKESSKEETKDNTVKEDKESDTKEEATDKETSKDESTKEDKSEEKAVEEKQESSKEETKDNTAKEDKSTESEKESSKEESTKEDKAVKETKEETPAKEEKQESTKQESSKDESVKENKAEEKAVEEKQETSKEKEQPVQEEKTTEKQETATEDNTKQEDNSKEESSDTLNELQSRLSNNLFGKLMS
jgi:hypothetical protein